MGNKLYGAGVGICTEEVFSTQFAAGRQQLLSFVVWDGVPAIAFVVRDGVPASGFAFAGMTTLSRAT